MSGYRVDAKVVLLGREYSGKTSIIERYIHNRFDENQPYQSTIGAAYGAKRTEAFGRMVTLGIWDTAGSERYQVGYVQVCLPYSANTCSKSSIPLLTWCRRGSRSR